MKTEHYDSVGDTLEVLQIRERKLYDTALELLLGSLECQDADGLLTADKEDLPSALESGSTFGTDIPDSARHLPERPDWFGPAEQLSLLAAGSASMLLDYTDGLLNEVEAHSAHAFGCRCDQLLNLFHKHIDPALREYQDLSSAIERLRHHLRSQKAAASVD